MDMIIYDSSWQSNRGRPKKQTGRSSTEPLITVSHGYGRIYFSAFAVEHFSLLTKGIKFVQTDDQWYLLIDNGEKAIHLTTHQGAYYLVARKISKEILFSFNTSGPLVLEILLDTVTLKNLVLHPLMEQLKNVQDEGGKLPGELPGEPSEEEKRKAKRDVKAFYSNNFAGRVKTQGILRAEQIIKSSSM